MSLARQLLMRCERLYNVYGPTETTIWSTVKRVTAEDELITIGRPLGNTQVYILDEQGHPVPENFTGEIYIAGDGVARGYLNRGDLTAHFFIPDPFVERGARL